MKAVIVMFDSLNRHMLPIYGCDWVRAPNFRRLAERTVTFDNCYGGSMPCMPARRELHTGRCNFLHRSWGPLEPFDDSMPQILTEAQVHTHLVTDHYHYWEDGGCTYHNRYGSYDFSRGQEGDLWRADLTDNVAVPSKVHGGRKGRWARADWTNRHYMPDERDYPQAKTFAGALEFLRTNHAADNWLLHVETFDPHEPYFVPQAYQELYPHDWDPQTDGHFDWPDYRPVTEEPRAVEHVRCLNAALISMCDAYLGKVLDAMDELDLWSDTLLIVNTDHGFLLGEHGWWAKCVQPFYNELVHCPLCIWDPRAGAAGLRRQSLVQTIDIPATLLEYFGCALPPDMEGRPLRETIADDAPVREAGLYGLHGGHVNVTDGRHAYMRAPAREENAPLFNYTLMPTHMRGLFSPAELAEAELAGPFRFTKGCPTLRIPSRGRAGRNYHQFGTLLFDLEADPHQESPIEDAAIEKRMTDHMVRLMRANDAPPEQYERLGLPAGA
jgi:arylsulfatase A-like enzyme